MSAIKETFKNTSWLFISQLITSIFGFIWIVLLARYLGVSDFGIVNFAIALTTILTIFIDLGITIYTTRDLSRYPDLASKYIGNGIPLKVFLSLITLIVTLIIISLMNYDLFTIEIILLFIIHFSFLSMGDFLKGVFQAFGKQKYQSIGIIINNTLVLIGTLILIYFNLSLIFVALSYISGSLISAIYLFIKIRKKIIFPKIEFDFKFWKSSIKRSIPFGITIIFTTLFYLMDSVMLSFMSGNTAVGIYSSAYKIIYVFTTLYTVYTFVVFPLMSKFYKDSENLLRISYEKSVKYLIMMMLPIAVGMTFYSEYIITLIFGNEFFLSGNVLRILAWNVLFVMINGASANLLNSSNNEVAVTKINGIACLTNFILNLILIYYLSYIGASLATIITGIVICILMSYVIIKGKYKPKITLIYDIIKIAIVGLILGIILSLINVNFWIAIPISIVIYIFSLILSKSLDSTDKAVIKEIIGK